jgi:hypothetical protein
MKTTLARSLLIANLFMLVLPTAANAEPHGKRGETLADFKAAFAAAHPSCEEIVYKSQRDRCIERTPEIVKQCVDAQLSCDVPGSDGKPLDPSQLQVTLKAWQADLERLNADKEAKQRQVNEARDDATRDKARAELKHLNDDIVKLDQQITAGKTELMDKEHTVGERMTHAETCVALRDESSRFYRDAKEFADNENDSQIAPLAKKLSLRYENAQALNAKASEKYDATKAKCEALKRKF